MAAEAIKPAQLSQGTASVFVMVAPLETPIEPGEWMTVVLIAPLLWHVPKSSRPAIQNTLNGGSVAHLCGVDSAYRSRRGRQWPGSGRRGPSSTWQIPPGSTIAPRRKARVPDTDEPR